MARTKKQQTTDAASKKGAARTAAKRGGRAKQERADEQVAPAPAPTVTVDAGINSRAMLVKVSLSTWTARRFDKKVTDEVNKKHAATETAGRYNKHLFGGSEYSKAHSAVLAAAGAARLAHYENTLPWEDDGWRLIGNANLFEYRKAVAAAAQRFEDARAEFLDQYDELREQARDLLNGMYDPDDYPSREEVARRFSMTVDYSTLPVSGDFRLDDLPADQIAEIRDSIQSRVERGVGEAMREAWNRLYEPLANIHERLTDPKLEQEGARGAAQRASIRDVLIENALASADVLGRLNITNDPQLDAMRKQVVDALTGLDAKQLREDKDARAEVASKADAILAQMRGIYGGPEVAT